MSGNGQMNGVGAGADGAAGTSAAPPKDARKKIRLIDMLLLVEAEIEDVDIWERVLHSEGEPLHPSKAHRREVLRQLAATLEMVMAHEAAFVALVKERRAQTASTARSLPRFTPRSEPTENTALSDEP